MTCATIHDRRRVDDHRAALDRRPAPATSVVTSDVAGGHAPYHPKTAVRRGAGTKLRTRDATAMAVGGMIGGGIFSVLGVAITLAGHLAFGCFVLGGVVAAITARSYAGVSLRSGHSGGAFGHLREQGHARLAGFLLWSLVFGYVVAMAVYSFTFGRYAASAIGVGSVGARLLSAAVVLAFLVVNLRGVRLSSLTEDLIVAAKLLVLFGIAIVGIASFSAARLEPLANKGLAGLFLGAATVFFAYEGFELITYDVDDMHEPRRTLPRSLFTAVAIVAAVYISVTIGAQMLVSDHAIVAQKEIAFAAVGEAALGGVGRAAAIAGAILATGSAINATLFSTARLIRDASDAGELPRALGRATDEAPVVALAFLSAAGLALAMLPGIVALIAFGSGAFLAVYTMVNVLEARMSATRWERTIAWIGVVACVAALGALFVELARDDPVALAILTGLTITVGVGRLLFVRSSSRRADGPTSAPRPPRAPRDARAS
jgi:amino acid transporter